MHEKYLRNQLKKIKKKWPSNLRPILQDNGSIRIVRSFDAESLLSFGIKTAQDLQCHQSILEKNIVTQDSEKVIQEFIGLLKTTFNSGLSPQITIPLLEEFFPGIYEEL